MTEYVAGFLFDEDRVALVIKKRPAWQAGKMNGIGGHIEPGETPAEAMVREFVEETEYQDSQPLEWIKFSELSGDGWKVHFFYSFGNHDLLKSPTDERIVSIPCDRINHMNCIPNLQWLVPMAKSMEHDPANLFNITEVR